MIRTDSASMADVPPAYGHQHSRSQLKAECYVCQAPKAKHRCGKCGVTHYCSVECQERDWPRHKIFECQAYKEGEIEATEKELRARLASGMYTPDEKLWYGSNIGKPGLVEELLKQGANPNFSMQGMYALLLASANGHVSVVQLLLAAGAHFDVVGGEFSTSALHLAANNGHLDIVKILVEAGANIHLLTSDGSTALDEARGGGFTAVANYLAAIEKWAAAAAEEAKKQAAAEANKATAAALAATEAAAQQAFAELMLEEGGQQTGAVGKSKSNGGKSKAKAKAKGSK